MIALLAALKTGAAYLALDPDYPQARWRLADALAVSGRYDESLLEINEAIRVTNQSPSSVSMLAVVYARMGRTEEARVILRELLAKARNQYVPPSTISGVYGALGDIERALDWMERSYDEGSNFVAYMAVEPWSDQLRSHPRFQSILQRTGQR